MISPRTTVTTGVAATSYEKVKSFPTKRGAGPWVKDMLPAQTSTGAGTVRMSASGSREAGGVSHQTFVSVEFTMSQDRLPTSTQSKAGSLLNPTPEMLMMVPPKTQISKTKLKSWCSVLGTHTLV